MPLIAIVRLIAFFLLAVIVATVLAMLVQTQINLAAPPATGAAVGLTERLLGIWPDLLAFLRLFILLVAAALMCALPLAEGLSRIFRPWRWLLFALAGAGGMWAALELAHRYLPGSAVIEPARETPALWAMMAAVGVASWLFGKLTRPKGKRGLRVLG